MKGLQWSYRFTVWLFRRVFPSVAQYETPSRPFEELKKEFRGWEILVFCLTALFGAITGLMWSWLFYQIGAWRFSRLPEGIVLTASWLLWVPGLFMGVATGGLLTFLIMRLFLKSRHRDYIAYQNQKFQVNNERMGPLLGIPIILGPIIMLIMLLNWYVIFTPEQIVIKPLFAISPLSYCYTDIESIHSAPAVTTWTGKTVNQREYVIIFHNGQKWSTNLSPALMGSEQKTQILLYVSLKSGVPMTERKVLDKSEGYGD
jgi:hypothetical protein